MPPSDSTSRKRALAEALTVVAARGVRVSTISSARDFPDPGSGERKARRAVPSNASMRCAWPSHKVVAT